MESRDKEGDDQSVITWEGDNHRTWRKTPERSLPENREDCQTTKCSYQSNSVHYAEVQIISY